MLQDYRKLETAGVQCGYGRLVGKRRSDGRPFYVKWEKPKLEDFTADGITADGRIPVFRRDEKEE